MNGWPDERKGCSDAVKPYWEHRGDITTVNGLILRGSQIVIPNTMRRSMLEKLHEGHLGIVKCKRRARNSCFWPNMNHHIENMIKGCHECSKYQPSKETETLQPHEVPVKPWQKIGTDLMRQGGKDYLIVTDYYSYYPEVYELKRTNALNVIHATKEAFSRHGIPEVVISDNGSQYTSKNYRSFARDWQFKQRTSSPRYAKSNGLAESSVKVVKNLIKKCKGSRQDILKGLLILRNTPLGCGKSPAELLMGRKLRDNIPSIETDRRGITRDLVREREEQKRYFDQKSASKRNVTASSQFRINQRVVVQNPQNRTWTLKGRIIEDAGHRSYKIKMENGNILRRNSRFIRKVYMLNPDVVTSLPDVGAGVSDQHEGDDRSNVPMDGTRRSRYGRVLKPKKPTDYNDL